MPSTSSVGWLGWQRDDSRPGSPSVLLARTTTWHLAPTVIRSKFDISLHAAAAISGVSPGAIARKLMSNFDLMTVGAKCQVVVRANNTLGLPGRLSSRCQPNHPTDDVAGILASAREGLSYGCGDAVIGVNPATDTPESTAEILRAVDDLLRRNAVPTQHCVLSHVRVQMKALELGCPMDLMFQSLAGTETANNAIAISVMLLTKP